jgi:hypothetical protein
MNRSVRLLERSSKRSSVISKGHRLAASISPLPKYPKDTLTMQYSGYRGRGRGSFPKANSQFRANVALPPERDMMEGLSTVPVGTLDKHTLCFVKSADDIAPEATIGTTHRGEVTFDDVKVIGSYNWTETPGKILVPGTSSPLKSGINLTHPLPKALLVFGRTRLFRSPRRRTQNSIRPGLTLSTRTPTSSRPIPCSRSSRP